jgi:hypothetical protein
MPIGELVGQPPELGPYIHRTIVNHMSMGYLNRNESYGCVNQTFVDQFPKIAGVASHSVPPQMSFSDDFAQFGCNAGVNTGESVNRPSFIVNDAVTWTRRAHTVKVGMEWRKLMGSVHANNNEAGSFIFGRGATASWGATAGTPLPASCSAVDSGSAAFRPVSAWYPRQHAWVVHAGDTWRVTDKLTVDYGLRWDYYSPSSEKLRSAIVPRYSRS